MTNERYLRALAEYVQNTVNACERSGRPFVFSGKAQGPFYGYLISEGEHHGRRKKAYWDDEKQAIIIRDPSAGSRGTVFVSTPNYRDRAFPYNWYSLPKSVREDGGSNSLEAFGLPDGRIGLVMSAKPDYTQGDHFRLHCFLGEALFALGRNREECESRLGVGFQEASSLDEELFLVRYEVLGQPRPAQESNRKLWSLVAPSRVGTSWDHKPKIQAQLMSNGALALTLGRNELSIFANSIDVALQELGASDSRGGRVEFMIRTSTTPEDAERVRDRLRELDVETRASP